MSFFLTLLILFLSLNNAFTFETYTSTDDVAAYVITQQGNNFQTHPVSTNKVSKPILSEWGGQGAQPRKRSPANQEKIRFALTDELKKYLQILPQFPAPIQASVKALITQWTVSPTQDISKKILSLLFKTIQKNQIPLLKQVHDIASHDYGGGATFIASEAQKPETYVDASILINPDVLRLTLESSEPEIRVMGIHLAAAQTRADDKTKDTKIKAFLPTLYQFLNDPSDEVRAAALDHLAFFQDRTQIDKIEQLILKEGKSDLLLRSALHYVSSVGTKEDYPFIEKCFQLFFDRSPELLSGFSNYFAENLLPQAGDWAIRMWLVFNEKELVMKAKFWRDGVLKAYEEKNSRFFDRLFSLAKEHPSMSFIGVGDSFSGAIQTWKPTPAQLQNALQGSLGEQRLALGLFEGLMNWEKGKPTGDYSSFSPSIEKMIADSKTPFRVELATILHKKGDLPALQTLVDWSSDPHANVRLASLQAMSEYVSDTHWLARAKDVLSKAGISDPDPKVREASRQLLKDVSEELKKK